MFSDVFHYLKYETKLTKSNFNNSCQPRKCTFIILSVKHISIFQSPPFTMLQFNKPEQTWEFTGGIESSLINVIKGYFNFTYKLINCHEVWAGKFPNNTWFGVIGLMSQNVILFMLATSLLIYFFVSFKKADLGLSGVSINWERMQVVKYLYPHSIDSITYMTKPPKIKPDLFLVLRPLEPPVWIGLLFTLLLLLLFDMFYKKFRNSKNNTEVFWISLNSLLRQQVHSFLSFTTSINVWIMFWLFYSFIITTSYAGCLYSLIAIPNQDAIDTVDKLIKAAYNNDSVIVGLNNSALLDDLLV